MIYKGGIHCLHDERGLVLTSLWGWLGDDDHGGKENDEPGYRAPNPVAKHVRHRRLTHRKGSSGMGMRHALSPRRMVKRRRAIIHCKRIGTNVFGDDQGTMGMVRQRRCQRLRECWTEGTKPKIRVRHRRPTCRVGIHAYLL